MRVEKGFSPGATNTEGEKRICLDGFESLSNTDCTTDTAQEQGISSLLLYGEENAISLRSLIAITNRDSRAIRQSIQFERLRGSPILANCQTGYFLAANEDERRRCVISMRHRAAEILKTANAIEKAVIEDKVGGKSSHEG